MTFAVDLFHTMAMNNFIQHHEAEIDFVLSCYDRVVISGNLVNIGHSRAATSWLCSHDIRVFDFPRWAEHLRDALRQHAELIARSNKLNIDFIQKKDFRKEERIKAILAERGDHPGLVHIFSAMEPCAAYKPWHDKHTHKTFLKSTAGKCLHYYFYFILPDLGLCYLRVPTWAPFRLQFYFNGHNELARKLDKNHIAYKMLDNAFVHICEPSAAQKLADAIRPDRLHETLNKVVQAYCPIASQFPSGYHWSLMQVEYATDIVFKRQHYLAPVYEELVRTATHAVKADDIATFLGRKLSGNYQDDMGNDFHTRIQGTRIKHHMGKAAIKMYDKHGIMLRIETTANDVSFFKHYREVVHRDGTSTHKFASMKKSIYSLRDLSKLLHDSNRRYIEYLGAIDDPTNGIKKLDKVSKSVRADKRTYRGFNLFDGDDLKLFTVILRGELMISGFKNADLRKHLTNKNSGQICGIIRRLRKHGIIKKAAHCYKYYLTAFGRMVVATALKLREMALIPMLRGHLCP
jgi:hypothetical protein